MTRIEKIESEIKKLNSEKSKIDLKLKPLKKELADFKQLEKNNALLNEGFDQELIDFYNYKVPCSTKADYYSWSIDESVEKYFDKLLDRSYMDRYQTYNFTEMLFDCASTEDINAVLDIDELEITKETLELFLRKKLKNFNGLNEDEIASIKLLMKMVYGIESDYFKWDW